MTKKNKPWVVEVWAGNRWDFLKRYEHQFQAKQHVADYNRMYDDDLLTEAELEMAGPKVKMRIRYDGVLH